MDETANLLIGLALILLSARMSAQIAVALKLPSVFGILLAGVLLGPSVTNLVPQSAALEGMSTIGVVLLLFVAGLETDLVQMRKVGTAALLAAVGGVAAPMAGVFFLSRYFGYGNAESVFIGTILTATSVTVSAHVLRELGYLKTKIGSAILGAAIIDDAIGVVVLTVVVNIEGGGSTFDLVRLGLFIPVSLYAGLWLVSLAVGRLLHNDSHDKYVEVLALVLAFAWAAQAIGGLAAISGAYLAGVLFGRTLLREDLAGFGNLIVYALFAPIFFVTTGMMTDVRGLVATPLFTSLLFVVAVLGKVVGSGVGALAGRFTTKESLAVGVGMVNRGEVAIVIAVLGRNSGVIGDEIFAASIVVTLLTTLVTPLLLRLVLSGIEKTIDDSMDAARSIGVSTLIERADG